tara:strand:+ start:10033 stop:11112 length:1080 start_codon:yes stop_codon:yes gene_type:complete
MKVEVLSGKPPSGKAHVYVINYERINQLESLDFCDVVVFDEVTRAKNSSSKRIRAFAPLLRHQKRWGLTGTPRPNTLLELFAQIRLLDGGKCLGRSFSAFRDAYFYPTDYMRYDWQPKAGSEEVVYAKISSLTLTLRSSEYLNIPDTIVEDVPVPLPVHAKGIYKELESEFVALLQNKLIVAANAAVLVGKLLQVCGGALYDDVREVKVIHDGKLIALQKLIKDISEPVIVACQFIHERERICAYLSGAVDASKFKGDIESEWNSGNIRILVADPRSLGHGLNLQAGGRVVIWYSPTWSRELYDQFNARVARKGQQNPPLVYRLVCTHTIDEVVLESLREKGENQSTMLRIMSNYSNFL